MFVISRNITVCVELRIRWLWNNSFRSHSYSRQVLRDATIVIPTSGTRYVSSSVSVSVLFPVWLPLLQGLPLSLPFCFPLAFSAPFVLPFGVPVSIWLPFSFLFSLAVSSSIREKWKHSVFTAYFPVPSSTHCVLASEPEKKKKTCIHTVFSTFREFGGSWMYRLRIGAKRGEQTEAETEVPTGVETKTEEQTERKTQPETQAEVETEAKSRVGAQTERNEVRSGSAANPLLPKVGITTLQQSLSHSLRQAHCRFNHAWCVSCHCLNPSLSAKKTNKKPKRQAPEQVLRRVTSAGIRASSQQSRNLSCTMPGRSGCACKIVVNVYCILSLIT